MAWLAGQWRGEGPPTDRIDAFVLPPSGGGMVGVFRRVRGGEVTTHAIAYVTEESGSLVLRSKLFDSALRGRESQDAPRPRALESISPSEVRFEKAGQSLAIRLKHFGPDLRGWEPKEKTVDFNLVRTEPGALYLDGVTYRRTPEGLESWVLIGVGDGGVRPDGFSTTRASAEAPLGVARTTSQEGTARARRTAAARPL